MNEVIIIGNLVKDPELKQTANNTIVSGGTIAVNRYVNNQQVSNFFNFKCFGKVAENFNLYVKKGNRIGIVGELSQNRYTNKDGKEVSYVEIIANKIDFLFNKNQEKPQQQSNNGGFDTSTYGISSDDLPFY